ncbi:uncharacterized protein MONBRDRAFT_34705 [Monosiga brevicollis MX1]|uniref:Secretory carrier membrane protein n=1 Tax=Monosiga brevicollis TaxID=81824 RepID=A9VDG7_MONBE|nr:uncharacterized protein MONBRDRAFT_34705 [Monosiga brevicollis MX1]EDQ84443.1 predicted protein [Monosiga brevicollis MX1]|eukprot:XP_001750738.1 hypothetical protein [Monosiga brevicollis MX1]
MAKNAWSDNPFGGGDDVDNPFADASVTSAQAAVPEYNPFDQPTSAAQAPSNNADYASDSVAQGAAAFGTRPAPPQPADEDVPSWMRDEPASPATASAAAAPAAAAAPDQAQNASKNKPVTQREVEYAERERLARLQEKGSARDPNFPNFPQWMRNSLIKPCFHLDIKTEIPVLGQRITRISYYAWLLLLLTVFWNMICMLAALAGHAKNKGQSAGLSVAYLFICGPAGYMCWFQTLYTAFRKDSSLRFGWFFLVMGCQAIISIIFSIGIPGWGSAGVWVSIETIDDNAAAGILSFTGAGLWIFNSLLHVYILRRVLKAYRMAGYTTDDMQREAVVGVASNQTVRKAAVNAAMSS